MMPPKMFRFFSFAGYLLSHTLVFLFSFVFVLKNILLIIFFSMSLSALAQEPQDSLQDEEEDERIVVPPMNEKTKLGIKIGLGTAIMLGKEPNHPRPSLCLDGGMYFRYRFTRHWSVQPELTITYRGSNFSNSTDEYGSIRSYYLDFPLLLMYGLNENNTRNIVGGVQYSRLLNASIYKVGALGSPEEGAPALNNNDLLLIGGMQWHTPFVGFQVFLKYGLFNANKGLLPTLKPVSTGLPMHNCSLEINFIF